ncbi:hypothetical protein FQR65_LT10934 [Abscondita terminalis]|nr:hypothetical protein FQR65_LT10934 [Abscondita terminalis]
MFVPVIVFKGTRKISLRTLSVKVNETPHLDAPPVETVKKPKLRKTMLDRYFNGLFYLKDIKQSIPEKHFVITRKKVLQHMYLVDTKIAKDAVKKILPYIKRSEPHIVCETNAGLGLIATELLREGVEIVRLYESCTEFRLILKNISKLFPERIELFTKDIFHLGSLSYADRYDSGKRVKEMLMGIPLKPWDKDPVMTIIGAMPHQNFLKYLIRMIVLQQEITTYGRVQIFAFMQPSDYEVLESTPDFQSRSYKSNSILFQLLFKTKLLGKYSRKSFLPWKNTKDLDNEFMYLIKIVTKENLPVSKEHLVYLYYFIREGFRKRKQKLIPTMENWLPGIGYDLILSTHRNKFKDMSIYTEFSELHPNNILHVFQLLLNHSEFKSSPFVALMESQLLKDETVETDAITGTKTINEDDEDNTEDTIVE